MENTLKELIKERALCEIYTDIDDTSKFAVGYVVSSDENYTVIEMYDPHGHYDGIACFMTDVIIDIATETEYLGALSKLINHYKEKSSYTVESISGIEKIINVIKSEKRICDIELCESGSTDVTGYIETCNDNTLKIKNINKYGKNDGKTTVYRSTISFLSFDSADTVKLEILSM